MTSTTPARPRYAVYFAPAPDSALWRFGSSVIGYDADRDVAVDPPPLPARFADRWPAITADPARYGFHATLKAPFHLRDGAAPADVLRLAAALASAMPAVSIDGLAVAPMHRFVALLPIGRVEALTRLADAAVEALEPVRAPLDDADRQRRLAAGLSERQRDQLERYGYPYVGADFRFHMTLAGPVEPALAAEIAIPLQEIYGEMVGALPIPVDQIAVFEQPARDRRFRIIARYRLTG